MVKTDSVDPAYSGLLMLMQTDEVRTACEVLFFFNVTYNL